MTPAARAGAATRRRGLVYGYRTLRPEGGYTSVEVGYIGQSRRPVGARDAEHREDKPWSDIIVGSPVVLAEGWWSDGELDRVERDAIREVRPRYNVACNEGNRDRIVPWVAVEQRRVRDAAAGRRVWQPPQRVGVVSASGLRVPAWAVLAVAWVLLSAAVWSVVAGPWDAATGAVPEARVAVGWSPLPAGLGAGWLVWRAFREGARRARRRRRS